MRLLWEEVALSGPLVTKAMGGDVAGDVGRCAGAESFLGGTDMLGMPPDMPGMPPVTPPGMPPAAKKMRSG